MTTKVLKKTRFLAHKLYNTVNVWQKITFNSAKVLSFLFGFLTISLFVKSSNAISSNAIDGVYYDSSLDPQKIKLLNQKESLFSVKKNLKSSTKKGIFRPYFGFSYPLLGYTGSTVANPFQSDQNILYPGKIDEVGFGGQTQTNISVNLGLHIGFKIHEMFFAEIHLSNFSIRDTAPKALEYLPHEEYLTNGSVVLWTNSIGIMPISITLGEVSFRFGPKIGFSGMSWMSLSSNQMEGVDDFTFNGPASMFPVFGGRFEFEISNQAFFFCDATFIMPGLGPNNTTIPDEFISMILSVGVAFYI